MTNSKKVILITGASSGIGKASAEQLITEGHIVYGLARDLENLQKIEGLKPIVADVTDDKSLISTVNLVIENEGKIDVLFNNAGYGLYGAVEDVPIDDAKKQFEVNLFGLAKLTQLILPHMRTAGQGLIINMSSMGGKIYFPLGAWYHASKHAVEGFSDSLRLDVQSFGINVSIIEPGAIATNFGNVVDGPLMKYSGEGAYASIAKAFSRSLKNTYGKPETLSPPSVVAMAVSRAVNSKRPKTRYVAGKYARTLMLIRKIFGDRTFDKIALRQIR
ncbi:MAG: oxidoreductase [bacterium]|nr:oxidoreductase [bacterium]